jgi:putative hydrolase of the HAD superfamily
MPTLLLFDIGGVLIDCNNAFKQASIDLNIPHKVIDSTFDVYDREITLGEITPQELYLNCLKDNNLTVDISYNFMLSWISDYIVNKSTHDLVKELATEYQVGLFSNIYKGMVPELIKRGYLPSVTYSYQFLSCDMGLQKPDEEAYKAVMKKVNVPANQILFVDDKQENLDTARSLGWQNFWFLSTEPNINMENLRKLLLND